MKRITVVVTARPSYSRVRSALEAMSERPDVELQIIAAASAIVVRFGRVVDLIRQDGFNVVAEVPCCVEGDAELETAITTGLLTTQLATLFDSLQPDMVVTIADRHETLATAVAASYQHIPLCHIQGGEISGSIDDKVRNAVTQLADIHLVATAGAARRVVAIRPGAQVHVTGCPSIDLAAAALREGPLPGHDVVVLQHPVSGETSAAPEQIKATIEALKGKDVLWFWPGDEAGNSAMCKEMRLAGLKPVRNMAPLEFLRTLLGSGVLVGNSSVGIRECSFMGVPVINIGTRQTGRERGPNVLDVWYSAESIRAAVELAKSAEPPLNKLYGDGKAGERIAGILAGAAVEMVA
ncbi:MAG: UDP-N-acetylglucosamine 2-epimerase [Rhodospirillaceae bacterium]